MTLLSSILSLVACSSEPSWILRTDPLEPGEDCAAGGVAVVGGTDVNGDGTLQNDEVKSREKVCNGANGTSALLNSTEEPAGENCRGGGTRVDSGVDDNGNGVLEPEEIDATTYVCDGETPATDRIWYGGVSIASAEDVTEIEGYNVVLGSVYIYAEETVTLPDLRIVSGELIVYDPDSGNAAVPDVSLPALEIAPSLSAQYVSFEAPRLSFSQYVTLFGSMSDVGFLGNLDGLLQLSLYSFETPNDDGLASLESLEYLYAGYDTSIPQFPALETVGSLYMDSTENANLNGFSSVQDIGSLSIYNNTRLTDVSGLSGARMEEDGAYAYIYSNSLLCDSKVNALITSLGVVNYGTGSNLSGC